MQADSYKRLTTLNCDRCGKEYEPTLNKDGSIRKRNFKACSQWCQVALSKGVPKAEYLSTVPCEHCGTPFKPKKEPYGRALFCSRECFNSHDGVKNPTKRLDIEFKALRDQARIGKKQIEIILGMVALKEVARIIRIKSWNDRYITYGHKGELVTRSCKQCEAAFLYRMGSGFAKIYCQPCRKQRDKDSTKKARKVRRKRFGSTSTHRQRAKKAGVSYQPVKPTEVLERDGWKCHLCGIPTPKELRGTFEPNAPEVDHIVTLADGGAHSYRNLACACRSCNLKKGARSCGQLKIF
jgi:hypothetical protein